MMLNCVICHHCFVGKYLNQKTKLTLQQYGSCWLWWNTAKNGKFRKMAEALCCPSLVSSTFCRSAQSLICIHRFASPRHLRPDTQCSVLCCQVWSPVTATGAGSPSVTETSSGKTLELQTVHRFSQSRRGPLLGPSPDTMKTLCMLNRILPNGR